MLSLRELFRLPYRQTEGFGRALAQMMQVNLAILDFTGLAKRAAKLNVSLSVAAASGPIDVVVDSTGLKVYGEGEWKVRKHGVGGRTSSPKLHMSVNPATQEIGAEVLTDSSADDAGEVKPLLTQIAGESSGLRRRGLRSVEGVRRPEAVGNLVDHAGAAPVPRSSGTTARPAIPGARRVPSPDSRGRPESLEGVDRLSSSQPGRDRQVWHEAPVWTESQKPAA